MEGNLPTIVVSSFDDFILKPDLDNVKPNEARIFIDTREGSLVPFFTKELITKFDRNHIFVEQLAVGDFHVQSNDGQYSVIIERKSAADFVSSFYDGRLENQTPELAEYDDSILMIHGNLYEKDLWKVRDNTTGVLRFRRNFSYPKQVTSIITSLAFRLNSHGGRPALIQVNNVNSVVESLDYIARLIEDDRLVRARSPISRQHKKYATSITDPKVHRDVLLNRAASFPKIGKAKAQNLLNHFGWSEDRINSASIEDLMLVDGLAKLSATRIWETIHATKYSA